MTDKRLQRKAVALLGRIGSILLLLPFFQPAYFANVVPAVSRMYTVFLYVSILIIVCIYCVGLICSRCLPSRIVVIFTVYAALLVFSTVVNGGELRKAISEAVILIAVVMYSDVLLRKSLKRFLNAICPIFMALVFANFCSLFMFPGGMYEGILLSIDIWSSTNHWLLGYDNIFIVYLLPMLAFMYAKNLYLKRTNISVLSCVLFTIISLYSVLSRWQAGSVVSLLLFLVICFLIITKRDIRVLNAVSYSLGNAAVFLAIVILRVQHLFSVFIEQFLGKNLTFTGRTEIWDKSLYLCAQSPLVGYGVERVEMVVSKLVFNSTHNQYLWVLYRGGILQFGVFLWMLVEITLRMSKARAKAIVKITAAAICCIMLMWQMEAVSSNSIMVLFVFAYYSDRC